MEEPGRQKRHLGEEGKYKSFSCRNGPSPKLGTDGKLTLFQSCLSAQSGYCAVGGTDLANPTKSISLDTSCKVSVAPGGKTPTWSSFVKERCRLAPLLLGAHTGGENFSSEALGLSAHDLVSLSKEREKRGRNETSQRKRPILQTRCFQENATRTFFTPREEDKNVVSVRLALG